MLLSAAPIGLGHLRAIQPLAKIFKKEVLVASSLGEESLAERRLWQKLQGRYEFLSRISQEPWGGRFALKALDVAQKIEPLEKGNDLSRPTLQVRILRDWIKEGLGRHLVQRAKRRNRAFLTSFYALAIAAEMVTVKKVFCVIPDSQVNRAWVAEKPKESKIVYFVPLPETIKRLKAYGVSSKRIFLTGFPLPVKNVHLAQADLARRLTRLDPKKNFWRKGKTLIQRHLQIKAYPQLKSKTPTVTFAIGGAGAQTKMVGRYLQSLRGMIKAGRLKINLVAGIRPQVFQYFTRKVNEIGLGKEVLEGRITIMGETEAAAYFERFNQLLRTTDILWTKPSELSFFTALGLPILMASPIGPHEKYNREWLLKIGVGIRQGKPSESASWLLAQIDNGTFAQAAFNGFLKAPREGTEKIAQLCRHVLGS